MPASEREEQATYEPIHLGHTVSDVILSGIHRPPFSSCELDLPIGVIKFSVSRPSKSTGKIVYA